MQEITIQLPEVEGFNQINLLSVQYRIASLILKQHGLDKQTLTTQDNLEKSLLLTDEIKLFLSQVGRHLYEVGDFEKAMPFFQILCADKPDNPTPYLLLAECQRMLGLHHKAINNYKIGLPLIPTSNYLKCAEFIFCVVHCRIATDNPHRAMEGLMGLIDLSNELLQLGLTDRKQVNALLDKATAQLNNLLAAQTIQ